jgi:Family of unknown function (DUF6055)
VSPWFDARWAKVELPDRTRNILESLQNAEESDHFVVRFSRQDPPVGQAGLGLGALGVRDQRLISRYISALERVYSTVTANPFLWPFPRTDSSRKTNVYVMYIPLLIRSGEAFTAIDQDGVPYVCLPCRSSEPLQNGLDRAEMEAVHEATHVFCFSMRPPVRSVVEMKWRWFGEATALFMETFVFPGNLDSTRFATDWMDFPEISLDRQDAQYQSGFFARYLAKRFGGELIARVWSCSRNDEGPLDALNRLLPPEHRSRDRRTCAIFGEYARDSYWGAEFGGGNSGSQVACRGTRALTASFVLDVDGHVTSQGILDHLACRYYRIEIQSKVKTLDLRVCISSMNGEGFRCFVSTYDQGDVRLAKELKGRSSVRNQGGTFCTTLRKKELENCEAIILTIANCGARAEGFTPSDETHDDSVDFGVDISAG